MTKKWKIIKEEDLHLFHPVRRVTLVDGSRVAVDLVTGITCGLDEQLQKTEELEEKYKQRMSLRSQIEMLNQNLPDSTKILDLITLGEFRQLLELAEEDPSMEITFELAKIES